MLAHKDIIEMNMRIGEMDQEISQVKRELKRLLLTQSKLLGKRAQMVEIRDNRKEELGRCDCEK